MAKVEVGVYEKEILKVEYLSIYFIKRKMILLL